MEDEPPITPHSFRRSFATYKHRDHVPLRQISILMGHTDVKTTELYIVPDDEEHLMDYPSNLSYLNDRSQLKSKSKTKKKLSLEEKYK